MSTEVITEMMQDFLCQEHVAQWKINKLSCMKTSVLTPVFSPFSDIDVKFCMEIWYHTLTLESKEDASVFKVTLVKLFASEIQPSLKVEFYVTANYANGTLFKKYECESEIDVNTMNSVTCIDDISKINENRGIVNYFTTHGSEMRRSNAVILKLRMKFNGHLSTPSVYCGEMRSLNNLKKFAKDFNALMQPSALSDIIIRIEGKDLPAHKAVLAAHSPVFMKMMESDFLESKTNTITISDFKYDIFECFLKYLYSGEIKEKSWSNVRELYFLADKYCVQTLKKECVAIFGSFLTIDQFYDVLQFAYDYNDSELKDEAKRFTTKHFHEIVDTLEWRAFVASHPIIGYEVLTSAYFVLKIILERKELVTLASGSNKILTEEK